MSELLLFVAAFIWLLSGGVAFALGLEGLKCDEIGAFISFCLLLAPFALGVAATTTLAKKRKAAKQ